MSTHRPSHAVLAGNRAAASRRGEELTAVDVVPAGAVAWGPGPSTCIEASDPSLLGLAQATPGHEEVVMVYVGIDWSEKFHDIELIAESGERLRSLKIGHGIEGLAKLHATILECASEPSQVVVGIESNQGLLVNALIGSGYTVYAINPLVSARYRDRHSLSAAK